MQQPITITVGTAAVTVDASVNVALGGGRPDASTTGHDGNLTRTFSGTTTITQAWLSTNNGGSLVLENVAFTGRVNVQVANLTIRNFKITGGNYGVYNGVFENNVPANLVLEDGEVSGQSSSGLVVSSCVARRLHLHDMGGDATKLYRDVTLEDSFITRIGSTVGAHADGLQMVNGRNVTMRRNNFDLANQPGFTTSQVIIIHSDLGTVDDVLIEGNWINGGAFSVNIKDKGKGYGFPSNVRLIANRFGRDFQFGPWVWDGGTPELVGNVWDDTGLPILPSPPTFGPAGRWPSGFAAYATQASVVTNGSMSDLNAKLASLASGIIEHPGDITGNVGAYSADPGAVVIRPPLGQRNNYSITGGTTIKRANLCVAGYNHRAYLMVQNLGVKPSGIAWCESDGYAVVDVNVTGNGWEANGFIYEWVCRNYMPGGTGGGNDRSRVNAPSGTTGKATIHGVGCYLTGSQYIVNGHLDTVQCFGAVNVPMPIRFSDSVLWPGDDKVIQGNGFIPVFEIERCVVLSPGQAKNLWPGGGLDLRGWYIATAVGSITDSLVCGSINGDYDVTVSGSELFSVSGHVDGGGNTVLTSAPTIPTPPTHQALDAIWHD